MLVKIKHCGPSHNWIIVYSYKCYYTTFEWHLSTPNCLSGTLSTSHDANFNVRESASTAHRPG